ncbi:MULTISPECIES: cytochrome c [unclassified Bradyrhizobium]|uniref:cytochrome c n=1 Tax=unclassified Bradyrhizobium TaxID=2631580 RepID=UPI000427BD64|nr:MULTISPECIES: cytochrome c [unclassified Bradyrhizobium]MCP3466619.1 cytochrome c [Bradyrhizobium sp. CCGUVB23]
MRLSPLLAALALATAALSQALAQADNMRGDKAASELMAALQFQHIKLWSAGRLGNWPLATYELNQIEAGLGRVAQPTGRADQAVAAVQALRSAVGAKDAAAFTKAYGDLTNGCNACHRAEGYGFITLQVPANSPFTDQLFVDQLAEARWLARSICGNCHVVSDRPNEQPESRIPAPSFPDIASRPSFSSDDLRQLLTSGHRYLGPNQSMPNPRLASHQVEALVALFETLRAERSR